MVAHLKRGNNDERLRSIGIEAEQATHSRAILAATAEYQSRAAATAEYQNSEAAQQCIRGGKCSSAVREMKFYITHILSSFTHNNIILQEINLFLFSARYEVLY